MTGATSSSRAPVARLSGVTKAYGPSVALDLDSLEVEAGHVTAIVGENGAGKSTLMGILAGTVTPDTGAITIGGETLANGSPQSASRLGVAMVSQEFPLVSQLDVTENLSLGQRHGDRRVRYDFASAEQEARSALAGVGVDIDVHAKVGGLAVPLRQLIEIAKALSRQPRLLILDEPTSALGLAESQHVLDITRAHAASGGAVIFVGHRLDEVVNVADRIVVLRNGRIAADLLPAQATEERLVREMVGETLNAAAGPAPQTAAARAPVTLEVQDLQAERLGPVSLQVRAGEVVGLAGLMGSGRSRLLHVLFGAIPATGGSVRLAGRPYAPRGPADAVEAGIGMVPEDRKLQSLIPDAPIRWNVTLAVLRRLCVWKFVLGIRKEKRTASELTKQARVLCRTIEQPVRSLSGGNQQRAIFARWLATSPRLLLLDEPTRGVDVGAKAEIYRIIDEARAAGMAVLAVSSELEELLATSMRIIVLRNGRVNDELTHGEFSKERIMMAATGTGGSR